MFTSSPTWCLKMHVQNGLLYCAFVRKALKTAHKHFVMHVKIYHTNFVVVDVNTWFKCWYITSLLLSSQDDDLYGK